MPKLGTHVYTIGRTKSDQLSYTTSYELTPETCHQRPINLYAAQVSKEY